MGRKKKKYDTEDYLWKENGINKLCKTCIRNCKQHAKAIINSCPLYKPKK